MDLKTGKDEEFIQFEHTNTEKNHLTWGWESFGKTEVCL